MKYRRLGLVLAFLIVATLGCEMPDIFGGGGTPEDVATTPPDTPPTEAPATEAPPPPPTEEPTTPGDGLDFTLSPNFGEVGLSSGFTPDPHTESFVSGGGVDVYSLDLGSACTGYVTSAPDFRINWSGNSSRLRIFFVAEDGDDTTLVVNDASGDWNCNDDSYGLDPMIELTNPSSGQIDIWVGSYSSGDFIEGTLYITELDYDPGNLPGGPPVTGGGATLVMNNESSETICYVRISPTTDTTWGDDWLGSTETIAPGASRTFDVSAGAYDLRAEDCSSQEIDVAWDVSISGSYTWNITGASSQPPVGSGATVVINNNSSETICYVRISPTTDEYWGPDWLGSSETMAPGSSRSFSVDPDDYDMRAENCDNEEIDVNWGASVSGTYTWDVGEGNGGAPPPVGGGATVVINNNSSATICYVRISPVTDDYWGDDWLGSSETMGPGSSRSFSIDSGEYDMRVEDCSNNEIDVNWNVSVSGTYTWNVDGN